MEDADIAPLVAGIMADPDAPSALVELERITTGSPADGAELREQLAGASSGPSRAARWLVEAANLWAGPAGDAKRAARALRAAVELVPTDDRVFEQLSTLYRDNRQHRALARAVERRAQLLRELAAAAPPREEAFSIDVLHEDMSPETPVPLDVVLPEVPPAHVPPVDVLPVDVPAAHVPPAKLPPAEAAAPPASEPPTVEVPEAPALPEDEARAIVERAEAGEPLPVEASERLVAIVRELEEEAVAGPDLGKLRTAFELAARALSGAARARELVRQAEVLVGLGAERAAAVRHAEAGLAGLEDAELVPLLNALLAVGGPDEAIDLHERLAERAAPEDRLHTVERAAEVAVKWGSVPRLERFFRSMVAGVAGVARSAHAGDDPVLAVLERAATEGDRERGGTVLRRLLASALSRAEPAALDGGRTKSALLRRASRLARRDLADQELAFEWLADALFARLEGALEDQTAALRRVEELTRDLSAHLPLTGRPAPTFSRPPVVPPQPPPTFSPPTPAPLPAPVFFAGSKPPVAATPLPPLAKPPVAAAPLPPLAKPPVAAAPLPPLTKPPVAAAPLPPLAKPPVAAAPLPPLTKPPVAAAPPPPLAKPPVAVTPPPPPAVPARAAPPSVPAPAAPRPPSIPAPAASPPPSVPLPAVPRPPSIPAPAASPTPVPVPAAPRPPAAPAPAGSSPPSVPMPVVPRPPSVPAPAASPAPSVPVPAAPRPPSVPPPVPAAPRPPSVPAPAGSSPPSVPMPAIPLPAAPVARPGMASAPPSPSPARPGSVPPPPPLPRAPSPSSQGRERASRPGRRAQGDELIADLFEAMPALTFCKDSVEASVFTLRLAMDKLASDAGMAHLYDIDRREFVVVHAAGPVPGGLLGVRTGDADPLAAEALRTRGAIIVPSPASDPRLVGRRWEVLRSVAGRPIVSVACVRAAQAGRFLGLIELVNLGDGGGSFAEGDDNALFYIAEKFTEFVAAHGVILSGDG